MEEQDTQPLKLDYAFTFWFSYFRENKMKQVDGYEHNLNKIGDFETAEEFWGLYQQMRRPDSLPKGCEFYMFKDGIKPLWEDKLNKGGGRFVLHIKKLYSNKIWEDILLALLGSGEDFSHLHGIVINVRSWEILVSIWVRELSEEEDLERYRAWVRVALGISESVFIDFKKHPNPEDMKQKQVLKAEEQKLIQAREAAKANKAKAMKDKSGKINHKKGKGTGKKYGESRKVKESEFPEED